MNNNTEVKYRNLESLHFKNMPNVFTNKVHNKRKAKLESKNKKAGDKTALVRIIFQTSITSESNPYQLSQYTKSGTIAEFKNMEMLNFHATLAL